MTPLSLLATSAAAVSLAAVSLVAAAPPAAAACAAPSNKYVGGTAKGQDGWDVNVQIGITIVSTSGGRIGMDGCYTAGYGKSFTINPYLTYQGAPHTSSTTYKWRVDRLPANAAYVWIETWPRDKTSPTCPQCGGPVTTKKYGQSMRRRLPVNKSDIRLTLPLTCAAKGRTGVIWGRSYDRYGKPITITRLHAWSEAPDSQTAILGFGAGSAYNGNYYGINSLASGQTYVVWANAKGYATKKIARVTVNACRTTPLTIRFG